MPFPRSISIALTSAFLLSCASDPAAKSSFLIDSVDASSFGSFTLFDETRRALKTPVGERVTAVVEVPPSPVMRFAIAASTMGNPVLASAVTFRLSVDGQVVFEDVVRRSQPNRWYRRELDLNEYTGKRVRLSFEADSAAAESTLPLWGNPVLVERGAVGARPDIVLVSIDCLRADHLGVYGYERDTSSNLDYLAKESVVFRHAMATSSYTLPTHASMLTGLPPSFHGASAGTRISEAVPYAPELLAEAGYRVNALVSAPFLSTVYGFDRGVHTYRLMSAKAPRLVDEAIELLREGEGQSRFLFFHLFDVHMPYAPPREFRTRFGERPRDITSLLERVESRSPPTSEREVEEVIRLYDGEIAFVDRELGRFFDYLRASGAFERSLIVVTADHGEGFYELGEWEHARPWHPGPGLYQEVLHVPLILKWPGISASSTVDKVVSHVDVSPTLLRAGGILASTSWARDLREPSGGRTLIAEYVRRRKDLDSLDDALHIALRKDSLKFLAAPGREELYDLSTDPGEKTNLAASQPDEVLRFRSIVRDYLREVSELESSRDEVTLDERTLEQLKALGYVEP